MTPSRKPLHDPAGEVPPDKDTNLNEDGFFPSWSLPSWSYLKEVAPFAILPSLFVVTAGVASIVSSVMIFGHNDKTTTKKKKFVFDAEHFIHKVQEDGYHSTSTPDDDRHIANEHMWVPLVDAVGGALEDGEQTFGTIRRRRRKRRQLEKKKNEEHEGRESGGVR